MKLRILFVAAAVAFTVSAFAQYAGTVTLASSTKVTPDLSAATIAFQNDIHGNQNAGKDPQAYGYTIKFDTKYVNLVFTDANGASKSVKEFGAGNYALGNLGWAFTQQAGGVTLVNTAYGSEGNVYSELQVLTNAGSPTVYFPKDQLDLMLNYDGSQVKAIVNHQAIMDAAAGTWGYGVINALANGKEYKMVQDPLSTSRNYYGGRTTSTRTVLGAEGNSYKSLVPEPGTIIAVVTGLGGLLAIRRRK